MISNATESQPISPHTPETEQANLRNSCLSFRFEVPEATPAPTEQRLTSSLEKMTEGLEPYSLDWKTDYGFIRPAGQKVSAKGVFVHARNIVTGFAGLDSMTQKMRLSPGAHPGTTVYFKPDNTESDERGPRAKEVITKPAYEALQEKLAAAKQKQAESLAAAKQKQEGARALEAWFSQLKTLPPEILTAVETGQQGSSANERWKNKVLFSDGTTIHEAKLSERSAEIKMEADQVPLTTRRIVLTVESDAGAQNLVLLLEQKGWAGFKLPPAHDQFSKIQLDQGQLTFRVLCEADGVYHEITLPAVPQEPTVKVESLIQAMAVKLPIGSVEKTRVVYFSPLAAAWRGYINNETDDLAGNFDLEALKTRADYNAFVSITAELKKTELWLIPETLPQVKSVSLTTLPVRIFTPGAADWGTYEGSDSTSFRAQSGVLSFEIPELPQHPKGEDAFDAFAFDVNQVTTLNPEEILSRLSRRLGLQLERLVKVKAAISAPVLEIIQQQSPTDFDHFEHIIQYGQQLLQEIESYIQQTVSQEHNLVIWPEGKPVPANVNFGYAIVKKGEGKDQAVDDDYGSISYNGVMYPLSYRPSEMEQISSQSSRVVRVIRQEDLNTALVNSTLLPDGHVLWPQRSPVPFGTENPVLTPATLVDLPKEPTVAVQALQQLTRELLDQFPAGQDRIRNIINDILQMLDAFYENDSRLKVQQTRASFHQLPSWQWENTTASKFGESGENSQILTLEGSKTTKLTLRDEFQKLVAPAVELEDLLHGEIDRLTSRALAHLPDKVRLLNTLINCLVFVAQEPTLYRLKPDEEQKLRELSDKLRLLVTSGALTQLYADQVETQLNTQRKLNQRGEDILRATAKYQVLPSVKPLALRLKPHYSMDHGEVDVTQHDIDTYLTEIDRLRQLEAQGFQFALNLQVPRVRNGYSYAVMAISPTGEEPTPDKIENASRRENPVRVYFEVPPNVAVLNLTLHDYYSSKSDETTRTLTIDLAIPAGKLTPEQAAQIIQKAWQFLTDTKSPQATIGKMTEDQFRQSFEQALAQLDQRNTHLSWNISRSESSGQVSMNSELSTWLPPESYGTGRYDAISSGIEGLFVPKPLVVTTTPTTVTEQQAEASETGPATQLKPPQTESPSGSTFDRNIPSVEIKADKFKGKLAVDVEQLRLQVLIPPKDHEKGAWNLAVAALATKGLSGILVLNELKLRPETRQEIAKALQVLLTEATTKQRPDLEQIKREVEQARNGLETASYIELALNHELVAGLFDDDLANGVKFMQQLKTSLEQYRQKHKKFPDLAEWDQTIVGILNSW